MAIPGDPERLEKSLVIAIVGEDVGPVVPAIHRVVDQTVGSGARKSSHDAHVSATRGRESRKMISHRMPLS
jgi:hypothetical protein